MKIVEKEVIRTIIEKTYVADDGTVFDTEKGCREYERLNKLGKDWTEFERERIKSFTEFDSDGNEYQRAVYFVRNQEDFQMLMTYLIKVIRIDKECIEPWTDVEMKCEDGRFIGEWVTWNYWTTGGWEPFFTLNLLRDIADETKSEIERKEKSLLSMQRILERKE